MTFGLNCWEVMACGRETGGAMAHELGVCIAATFTPADGLNNGRNGGRICWAIAGTFCQGRTQGTYCEKRLTCLACSFYQLVQREEGAVDFQLLMPGQSRDCDGSGARGG